jgi:hypothetical protein
MEISLLSMICDTPQEAVDEYNKLAIRLNGTIGMEYEKRIIKSNIHGHTVSLSPMFFQIEFNQVTGI